ncbi:MAG: hypothetical protein R3275_06815, partial [Saprospiraceae bacterium]|nr:hypothetical protein [Saprospiraceae bacterium]
VFIILLLGCDQGSFTIPVDPEPSSSFMPLSIGAFWTYKMDSIIYDPEPTGIVRDTIQEEVRLEIVDTLDSSDSGTTYVVERYTRNSDTTKWRIRDVWSFKKDRYRFIATEENIPYIKLMFPLDLGTSWDGNTFIDEDEVKVKIRGEELDMFKFWSDYRVTDRMPTDSILSKAYQDVITVEHADREILIEKRLSLEKYAKDVGMIYKKLEILDTQNIDTDISFYDRAQRGFILEMWLIDHQ